VQPQALGLEPSPAFADQAALDKAFAALDEAKQKEALTKFLRDQRDTASPRAIATLLVKVASSHLIQPRYASLMFDLMRRSKVADDRLKGGLPGGWTFSHMGATARTVQGVTPVFHDAGVASHKKDGRIVLVLFIEGASLSPTELAQFHRATAHSVVQAWS
jgi:beta-lactamase class A